MRNVLLIACLALIVLICGCSSSNSPSSPSPTVSPTASPSVSPLPIATPLPAVAAPTIGPGDPASYKVNVNFGSNPYLYIEVMEDATRLKSLEIRYTPEMGAETSNVIEGKYLTNGLRSSLGKLADSTNVTVIATYGDGASRTLFVLHQNPTTGRWSSY